MKRKLASAIVVIGLLASSMTPASAIFGLSKCEKVKKQIKSELAIGDLLFKSYRNYVSLIKPKTDNETYGEHYKKYETALNTLDLVLDSDIKAWSTGQKYPQCFTTEQNSGIRTGLKTFSSSSKNIKKTISKGDIFESYDLKNVYTGRLNITKVFFKK